MKKLFLFFLLTTIHCIHSMMNKPINPSVPVQKITLSMLPKDILWSLPFYATDTIEFVLTMQQVSKTFLPLNIESILKSQEIMHNSFKKTSYALQKELKVYTNNYIKTHNIDEFIDFPIYFSPPCFCSTIRKKHSTLELSKLNLDDYPRLKMFPHNTRVGIIDVIFEKNKKLSYNITKQCIQLLKKNIKELRAYLDSNPEISDPNRTVRSFDPGLKELE